MNRGYHQFSSNLVFEKLYPSRRPLHWILNRFIEKDSNVNFIQIGANDGISNDPLRNYKKGKNWNGVLLEPQKKVFKLLQQNFTEDRYFLLNYAMAEQTGIAHLYKLNFSDSRWANGISSFNKNAIISHFENGYIQSKALKEGITIDKSKDYDHYITQEEVKTISYQDIIKKEFLPGYNAIFIDVEGFDFEILKMVDLKSAELKLIIYENKHLTEEERKNAVTLLQQNEFVTINFGPDTFAVRNFSPQALKFLLVNLKKMIAGVFKSKSNSNQ